jgi:hypothetical protein
MSGMKFEKCISENRHLLLNALLILGMILATACAREFTDPVYIDGTLERNCMLVANNASDSKYGVPTDQSIKVDATQTSVWIGATKLGFHKDEYFTLRNKYQAMPEAKGRAPKYIEGIWAGARLSVSELAVHYPEVFIPEQAGVFYIDLRCSLGGKAFRYDRALAENHTPQTDTRRGLISYTYGNGRRVVNFPINQTVTDPDGSQLVIDCDHAVKTCTVAFSLSSNIRVVYTYPLSQLDNWLRIQQFVVDSLNEAKG